MNREHVAYGVVGTALGLVLGFMVANWTSAGMPMQTAKTTGPANVSVNSAGGPQLPPGHPDIGPAQSLPAGHPDISSGAGASAADANLVELPSLDPLPTGSKQERAEHKYKNIQVLKGIPADRLMSVMFAFKSSLGVDCTYCHIKDQWEKDDKQTKQIARKMIQMTRDINNQYVGGIGRVTCMTCHRGQPRPLS
jgi:hypothetical protein